MSKMDWREEIAFWLGAWYGVLSVGIIYIIFTVQEIKMDKDLAEWIVKAIETIKSGVADKLEKDNVKVYRVVNIIRIDVKE